MPHDIETFMLGEHEALHRHLAAAIAGLESGDRSAYDRFREELLRHIGLEEKILLPAIQQAHGGEPSSRAAEIRLDHGALAALLVPPPSPTIVNTLCRILAAHEPREEGPTGVFREADAVLGAGAPETVERLRDAPPVPVSGYNASERVMPAVQRALERGHHTLVPADDYRQCEVPAGHD